MPGPRIEVPSRSAREVAELETFAPHDAVLPHVAAVVTQCALSTLSKVLANGLPMVCLPVIGDQPANAARIEALGAGIRLGHEASSAAIGDAIRNVLDEAAFRGAAERYGPHSGKTPTKLW
jgi:UDP:flavonoid glycosyltransferase YjiC (YdhE family)